MRAMEDQVENYILILGSGPEANALSQCIEQLGLGQPTLEKEESSWLYSDHSLSDNEKESLREKLKTYDAVISLPAVAYRSSGVLSLIHRLRTPLRWEGHFIAVVSKQQIEDLRQISLSGDSKSIIRFQDVPAHTALRSSLQLPELLKHLSSLEYLALEAWHFQILDGLRTTLQNLSEAIERGRAAVAEEELSEAQGAARAVGSLLREIDFLSLPISHRLERDMRELANSLQKNEHSLQLGRCSEIFDGAVQLFSIEETEHLLAQTSS